MRRKLRQTFKNQKGEDRPLEELERQSCAIMETKTEFQVEGSICSVNFYKDIKEDENLTIVRHRQGQ